MTRPSLPNPLAPVGYRRDARPIYPILGGSPEHDPSKPDDAPGNGGVTQEDLSRLLAREKTQGGRAAVKKLLDGLGFNDADSLSEFTRHGHGAGPGRAPPEAVAHRDPRARVGI